MNRKTIARVYASIGAVITTIFAILLSILSADPIQPVQWIGWAFVGQATGLIILFVAADLYRRKEEVTISNITVSESYVNLPIIKDFYAASALLILIMLLISGIYEDDYMDKMVSDFSWKIFLVLAITHYSLNRLVKRLMNPS